MKWILAAALLLPYLACAAAPVVLHSANHESPVRGGPGELLQIQGYGFKTTDQVVYEAADAIDGPGHPAAVPLTNSAILGFAPIINRTDPPYAITVQLPDVIAADTPYRLWVVDHDGVWSESVAINDPRPLWISPAVVYSSVDHGEVSRTIRVVGRNLRYLDRSDGMAMMRLRGPSNYDLAAPASVADRSLAGYVREGLLPVRLTPGQYSVSISNDGRHWRAVPDQMLVIRPDPPPQPQFELSEARFGSCGPDDGRDDSACLSRALEEARRAGGAVIRLGPGVWDLSTGRQRDGFVVAPNVHIQGAGQGATIVRRHGAKQAPMPGALMTLTGHNVLTGISFTDDEHYESPNDTRSMVQLGLPPGSAGSMSVDAGPVEDVLVSRDAFVHVGRALLSGGRPIHRLVVTHNEFGAFETALMLTGGRSDPAHPYEVEDSIFRDNLFAPGSYLDIAARQGTVASQIGASHRVDFSGNFADGASRAGLQNPDDPPGWRAGFFWSLANNNEELLISGNRIDCSGDKAGDGEAVSLDANGSTLAFDGVKGIAGAGDDWVSVPAALVRDRDGQPFPTEYIVGQWISIVDGAGLGQTRKIRDYVEDGVHGTVRFRVTQHWDVVPRAGQSRLVVTRQYWQVYIIANSINHASPPCRKSNFNGPHGGVIGLWTSIADSVVEGNEQDDTDGIEFLQSFSARPASCPTCAGWAAVVTALEIRDNRINGEYDWSSDCSWSGIRGYFVATPTPAAPPPWLGFGIVIANNEVTHADGQRGGAIEIARAGLSGPPPGTWPMSENILIFGNTIRDISGPPPRPICAQKQETRSGIRIEGDGNIRDTVLAGNVCERVDVPLQDSGAVTSRVCTTAHAGSCECKSP